MSEASRRRAGEWKREGERKRAELTGLIFFSSAAAVDAAMVSEQKFTSKQSRQKFMVAYE